MCESDVYTRVLVDSRDFLPPCTDYYCSDPCSVFIEDRK